MRNINFYLLFVFFLLGFNNSVCSQVVSDYDDFSIFIGDLQKSNSSIESLASTPSGDLLCVQNKASFFRSFTRNKSKYSFDLIKNYTLPPYNPTKFYGEGKKSKLFNYTFLGNSILGVSSRTSFFNRNPELFYHIINPRVPEKNNHGFSFSSFNSTHNFIDLSRISMVSSENSDFAAVLYIPKTKQEEQTEIKYSIFTKDSSAFLERAFLFPYPSEAFIPLDFYILSREEHLFFAGQYPEKAIQNSRFNPKQVYRSISIEHIGSSGVSSHILEVPGYYFTDIKIIDNQGGVILSALYTTNLDGFKIEGLLKATINSAGEVINKTLTPIALKELELLYKKANDYFPEPTNSDLDFSKYTFLDFRKVGDDFLCVAELNAVEYRYGGADMVGRGNTVDTYFWSGNLLVLKIDAQGKMIWANMVPKIQRTINDGGYYLSSSVYFSKDKVHIFFNDNLLNYNNERHYIKYGDLPELTHLNAARNTIAHVSIQLDNGKMNRENTIGRLETNVIFVPKLSVPFEDENKLVIYGQNGNKHRIGSINFTPYVDSSNKRK